MTREEAREQGRDIAYIHRHEGLTCPDLPLDIAAALIAAHNAALEESAIIADARADVLRERHHYTAAGELHEMSSAIRARKIP